MEIKVNSVFYRDPSEPVELSTVKSEVPTFDGYRFRLSRHIQAEIEFSKDAQDGKYYELLIGFFVNGEEIQYVTDWIPNGDELRKRDYAFELPGRQKFLKPNKVHTVELKFGLRKFVKGYALYSGANFEVAARNYDLLTSKKYYYKVGPRPSE